MKLIVDAGGSKTHWCLTAPGQCPREWTSRGVNAVGMSADELRLALECPQPLPPLEAIYFYGAGVVDHEVRRKVASALPCAESVTVESDLLGAARAMLGHEPGVACILGTGSNSGLYDGHAIVSNVRPMGWILGDEGSGTSLGRQLLLHAYRGDLEPELTGLLEEYTGLDYAQTLARVYREPDPRSFLASLAPFIKEHIERFPLLERMVISEFRRFFTEIVARYGRPRVAIAGGVAAAFEPQLRQALPQDLQLIAITERPMPGLIKYHTS